MATQGPEISDLKRYLAVRSQTELANAIAELFQKIPAVKDYYQIKLNPQTETDVQEKYKQIIRKEFATDDRPGQARLSVARKAVMDFKKVAGSRESIADMMLFYVEQGVAFTNAFGDIDEPFYNSMECMYEKAAQWTTQHGLTDIFIPRFQRIVKETAHMGWGFHDCLTDIYQEFFNGVEA
ncbi:MAG: DUF6155 family protein [Cyanobacteria bacterium P01_H01_bin.153]